MKAQRALPRMALIPSLLGQSIALILIVAASIQPCAADDGLWPVVHLKTGAIYTETAGKGINFGSTRRRLLHHDCHTEHQDWGILKGARQVLLSHLHGLRHAEKHELLTHVESSGARVMGYLPENTWIVVGEPESLAAAVNHSLVAWSGLHEPTHKIAPQWQDLLGQIEAAVPSNSLKSLEQTSTKYGNATEATLALAAAALAQLPVRVQYRPGQWPQIGIRVSFPTAHTPQPQMESHQDAQVHQIRIQRVLQEKQTCTAGKAAVADWGPMLRDLFGNEIEVHSAGASSVVVFAPPQYLNAVLEWLAERPAVRWIAPLPRTFVKNRQASVIIQAARPAPSNGNNGNNLDPSIHPVWAAGITGRNQVIGQGDSGLNYQHCFFDDPNVDWASGITVIDRVRTFDSTEHRKIRLYRAFADFTDANGHGTHTAGTLAGIPYGTNIEGDGDTNIGMAPDAKLAFIDLSSAADGDAILTPYDLVNDYFPYTTSVGATIHSDSWGSTSVTYDNEAAQVDQYCWDNPTFLPVFPAGNDGDKSTQVGLSGDTTVNSPATSKNCIAAGATQTSNERASVGQFDGKVWAAQADLGPNLSSTFRVLQSDFSNDFSSLKGLTLSLVAASPLTACSSLTNAMELSGSVALIERGNCTFVEKAMAAQASGAVAALVFDDQAAAYFVATGTDTSGSSNLIPTATMPRRLGQNLLAVMSTGRGVNISFSPASEPQYGFENLASFSSQGPVGRDKRVKPDLVAPGTIASADANSANQCGIAIYGGTSMATPVLAGAAVLARQYFLDGYYPSGVANAADGFDPTSALVKAVLVAGADSLDGYEADTGLPIDPTPSFRQGFGRVFLGQSLYLQNNPYSPPKLAVLDAVPINDGDVHQFCITAGGGPLSIALVWTDYPGESNAAMSLVNDLDLVVRAEGLNGQSLLGNGGDVDDSSKPDNANNMEQVTLPAIPPGRVSIEVRGTSIQAFAGPQPYALVVNGDFTGVLAKPSDQGTSSGECAVVVAAITSGPEGVTNASKIKFEFSTTSGAVNGVAFECKMGDDKGSVGTAPGTFDWTACSSPATYDRLPDGTYTFSVRATGEKIDTSSTFTKDTAPPAVSLQADVPATTSAATAKITFAANDTTPVFFQCRVNVQGASPQQGSVSAGSTVLVPVTLNQAYNCTSPQTVAWLLPGQWTFSVQATDAAGNTAQASSYDWTVALDGTSNYARVTSGPLLKVPKRQIEFSIVDLGPNSAASTTECSLTPGTSVAPTTWEPCSGSKSYGQPNDGDYTFAARVIGDASLPGADGSLPPTWAVSVFNVDSIPPSLNITSGPTGGQAVGQTSISFEFSLSEEGSTATCQLKAIDVPKDSVAATPCASPVQLTNLTGGHYNLLITPSDAVGNVGTAVTAEFIVDINPPNITANAAVKPDDSVLITFNASDGPSGSGLKNTTCRVRPAVLSPTSQSLINADDPKYDWQNCTSPYTFPGLVEGHWVVGLMAYDNAGLSSKPVELDVWVDTIAPKANVTSGPKQGVVNPGGKVTFTLTDATERALGAGSPVQWQGFMAKAGSGSIGDASSNARTSGDVGPGLASSSVVKNKLAYAYAESVVELGRDDLDKWSNCTSDCTYSGLAGGSYVFQARGIDAAGNIGNASQPYAFNVEGSSSGLPQWALIAIIAGSVVGGIALILTVWWCCCHTRKPSMASYNTNGMSNGSAGLPNGAISSSTYGNGWAAYPYAPPPPPSYMNGSGGGANGYVAPNGNGMARTMSPMRDAAVPQDPVEAQELALALAASERAAREQRQAQATQANSAPQIEDAELRAAMEASLAEEERRRQQRAAAESEDAELKAAIEASLEEQRRQESYWRPSAPSPTPSQYNTNPYASQEEWPPRR